MVVANVLSCRYGHPSVVHYNYKLTNAFAMLCEALQQTHLVGTLFRIDAKSGTRASACVSKDAPAPK
eukprot:2002980-Amphidinium_carterae.1